MTITKKQGLQAVKECYEQTDPAKYQSCVHFLTRIKDTLVQDWHLEPEDSKEQIAEVIWAAEKAWDDESLMMYGLLEENCCVVPQPWIDALQTLKTTISGLRDRHGTVAVDMEEKNK